MTDLVRNIIENNMLNAAIRLDGRIRMAPK